MICKRVIKLALKISVVKEIRKEAKQNYKETTRQMQNVGWFTGQVFLNKWYKKDTVALNIKKGTYQPDVVCATYLDPDLSKPTIIRFFCLDN